MKLPCKVIEDMLPIYYDKVCSEESGQLIEEHLKDCPRCRQMLADLGAIPDSPSGTVDDIKPLKKIQKNYKKLRISLLIAAIAIVILLPAAFLAGNRQNSGSGYTVEFTKEEALAEANAFMACIAQGDYAGAYAYWDIAEEKLDLVSGNLFQEEELVNFEKDGLQKFCEGGEKMEAMGGIGSVEFMEISDPGYFNRRGIEDYNISYRVEFDGKEEILSVSVTKYGIHSFRHSNGMIRHPLSHLTLWVQWVVDDYSGQYYDWDLGEWVKTDP